MQHWQLKLQVLKTWWKTPLGSALLRLEKQFLTTYLQDKFGAQMVLLADESFADLTIASRTHNSIRIDPFTNAHPQLPQNIDVLLVPHMLAYCWGASQWLSAFWQSLEANGQLVLTGFNFMSCLGIQRLLQRTPASDLPSMVNSGYHLRRLLSTTDFNVELEHKFAAHCEPSKLTIDPEMTKAAFFGSLYCIIADKQLVTVKTFKTNWRGQAKAGHQRLANPFTTEERHHDR